jgi:hypothetical protein
MADDNLFSVGLPPVQWTAGTPAREHDSESTDDGQKEGRRRGSKLAAKPMTAPEEIPFELAAQHEVDSFA